MSDCVLSDGEWSNSESTIYRMVVQNTQSVRYFFPHNNWRCSIFLIVIPGDERVSCGNATGMCNIPIEDHINKYFVNYISNVSKEHTGFYHRLGLALSELLNGYSRNILPVLRQLGEGIYYWERYSGEIIDNLKIVKATLIEQFIADLPRPPSCVKSAR